jgi:uncharacterized protein
MAMKWEDGRRSDNVEDQRGQAPRGGFPMGGRGMRLGGLGGIGMIIVVLLGLFLGVDPTTMLSGVQTAPQTQTQTGPAQPYQGTAEEERLKDFVSVVLADTEDTWGKLFGQSNLQYQQPKLVLFSGGVQSACGMAQSAAGPFYCPADQKVYLDLQFFKELSTRFGAPGDFAQAYVIAHEVGHHVQTLLGTERQVRQAQARASEEQRNNLSVRMELQADCYAGIWAHHANRSRQILEQGDIEEALGAAQAVGDDTIQKQSQGYVVPDSFTHGSSEQRKRWFMTGLQTGDPDRCDTFSQQGL